QLVGGALGLDFRHAGVREPLLERLPQREILVQQLRVIAVGVPPRPPGLVEPEPESKRVNLLAHNRSFAETLVATITASLRRVSSPAPLPSSPLPSVRVAWARPRRRTPRPPARSAPAARRPARSDAPCASGRGTRGPSARAARAWPTAPQWPSTPRRTADRRRR